MAKEKVVFDGVFNTAKITAGLRKIDSDLSRIQAPLNKLYNGYSVGAKKAIPLTDRLARSMRSLKQPMRDVSVRANRIVTAMAGVGTTIVLFRTAAHSVVRFSKAMGEVAAITNANTRALSMMTREAQDLGATTMFTASQAAEGLKFLSMAGLNAAEATKSLKATLNLAQAGAIDLGTAADISTNILTAFRLEAEDLADVVDDIATVASRSNTSIVQLGDAMKYVSASASAFGISMQETSAAIGVLSDAGMQASLAGTGLRQVFIRITGQSAAMVKGMKALGITFKEIDPSVNSLTDILDRFARTNVSASEVTSMFGARAANAFQIMLQGRDKIKSLSAEQANNTGRAQQMADVMGNTLFGQLKKVQSAYEALFITMFESQSVATGTKNALEVLAGVLQNIAGTGPIFKDSGLEGWGGELDETYEKVQTLIEAFTSLVDVAIAVGSAWGALKLASALSALMKFVPTVELISKSFDKMNAKVTYAFMKMRAQLNATSGGFSKLILKIKLLGTGAVKNISKLNLSIKRLSGSMSVAKIQATGLMTRLNFSAIIPTVVMTAKSMVTLSTAMKITTASMVAAKVAALGLRAALQGILAVVGTILVPLLVLYAAIEGLMWIWNKFIAEGESESEKLAKSIRQIKDEVDALQATLGKAEFQIGVERDQFGQVSKKSDEVDPITGKRKPIKLDAIESDSDLIQVLNQIDEELLKAEATAKRATEQLYKLIEMDGDPEKIAELKDEIKQTVKLIKDLGKNRKEALDLGPDIIKQVQATKLFEKAIKGLNDRLTQSNRISEELTDTGVGEFIAQLKQVEAAQRDLEELNTIDLSKLKDELAIDFSNITENKFTEIEIALKNGTQTKQQVTELQDILLRLRESGALNIPINIYTKDGLVTAVEKLTEFKEKWDNLELQKKLQLLVERKQEEQASGKSTSSTEIQIEAVQNKLSMLADAFDLASAKIAFATAGKTGKTIEGVSLESDGQRQVSGRSIGSEKVAGFSGSGEIFDAQAANKYIKDLTALYDARKKAKLEDIQKNINNTNNDTDKERLKGQLSGASGFDGAVGSDQSVRETTRLITDLQKIFTGTGFFQKGAGKEALDLASGGQLQNLKPNQLVALETKLMQAAGSEVNRQEAQVTKGQVAEKLRVNTDDRIRQTQAQDIASQIEKALKKRADIKSTERDNQTDPIQEKINANLQAQAQTSIAGAGISVNDTKGQKANRQQMQDLKNEESILKAALSSIAAEAEGEGEGLSKALKGLTDKIKAELDNIAELPESAKAQKEKEIQDKFTKEGIATVEKEGDKSADKQETKDLSKLAANQAKQQKQKMKEAASERKSNANIAFSKASQLGNDKTEGEVAVSSLAAIGGGGGVGPDKKEQTQIDLQREANATLKQMLKFLANPTGFDDKDEARKAIVKGATEKELNTLNEGMANIKERAGKERAKGDKADPKVLEGLRAEAQGLVDALGTKVKEREIKPVKMPAGKAENPAEIKDRVEKAKGKTPAGNQAQLAGTPTAGGKGFAPNLKQDFTTALVETNQILKRIEKGMNKPNSGNQGTDLISVTNGEYA
jgi:TP901 family phage tail tape measure protein